MLARLAPESLSAHRAPEVHTAMHAEHVSTACGVRTKAKKELHDEKLMYYGKVLLSPRVAPWAVKLQVVPAGSPELEPQVVALVAKVPRVAPWRSGRGAAGSAPRRSRRTTTT